MIATITIQVVGSIHQPGFDDCAYEYKPKRRDVCGDGPLNRVAVERWLQGNAGDFREVRDYAALCGDRCIWWRNEESEQTFADAMVTL